jgi:hypothetical protein
MSKPTTRVERERVKANVVKWRDAHQPESHFTNEFGLRLIEDVDRLEPELQEARSDYEHVNGALLDVHQDLSDAQARNRELTEALRRHGHHLAVCLWGLEHGRPCECGLSALLPEQEGQQ